MAHPPRRVEIGSTRQPVAGEIFGRSECGRVRRRVRGIPLAQVYAVPVLRRHSGFTIIELLLVVGVMGIVAAFAVPMFGRTIQGFRLVGDARSLSNAMAVAKIRAAANFSRVRLYVDLDGQSHHLETLDRSVDPPHWTIEGGSTLLSPFVLFDYGSVASPPPSTQATIGQAPLCKTDDGDDIASTACVMFNSRGIPIDDTGAPTAQGALYITDGTAVYGVVVAATGMIRLWRTLPQSTPTWVLQ
jgi:prepilin-type N-terminal cleavage/methylation domain-containing protein